MIDIPLQSHPTPTFNMVFLTSLKSAVKLSLTNANSRYKLQPPPPPSPLSTPPPISTPSALRFRQLKKMVTTSILQLQFTKKDFQKANKC